MVKVVCLLVLALVVLAEPQPYGNQYHQPQEQYNTESKSVVPTLTYRNVDSHEVNYSFAYETANEIVYEERPYVKNLGVQPQEPEVFQGSNYSYIGPDGRVLTVTYIADENGFRPRGAKISTQPPPPKVIQGS